MVLASPLISTRSWIADADALRRSLPADTQQMLIACDGQAPPAATACEAATGSYYARFNGREPPPAEMRGYARTNGGRGFNRRLYEAMWGRSEFVATGTLRHYDGEPLLAQLDGRRTLFMAGQYDEAVPTTLSSFAARVPGGAEMAVIPGAAHGTFNDRPEETIGVLRGWMHRHDG